MDISHTERVSPPLPIPLTQDLSLESKVQELSLYECQIEGNEPGVKVAQLLQNYPLLPGVILLHQGKFLGMISRRRFWEYLSRPYGRELFLKRAIKSLYRFAEADLLMCSGEVSIVEAANYSLQRPPELLYEPIVIQLASHQYRLLDVHQLLIAQSKIHQIATQLLKQQTQSQLIQTEKMASLGQMVASIAHEIRNPITAIIGNLSCLSNYSQDLLYLVSVYDQKTEDNDPQIHHIKEEIDFEFIQKDFSEIVQSMQASATRLSQLVQGLHTFSHVSEGSRKEADIHECIDSTLLILKTRMKQGIEVIKDYGDLPLVKCYSGQLSQVFMNIISNAVDALEEQTERRHLEHFQFPPPTIWIRTSIEQDGIMIGIADNGPGMPPEIQQRVFETFFTTKPPGKGTGLGLAISYQIITEKHGGTLSLRSTPGCGTEFNIVLPLM